MDYMYVYLVFLLFCIWYGGIALVFLFLITLALLIVAIVETGTIGRID